MTNASRTQLMSLATLDWDEAMLGVFRIPRAVLPKIVSSSAVLGETRDPFPGVPVGGTVAVSLFADVNDNKKMDRGMMGIPKEPIGISNNATNSFSAPDFDKAKFVAKPDMTVNIALRYY